MSDWGRNCPVCGSVVRHNHTCHATEIRNKPLEGEEALAAVRRVKAQLLAVKHPEQVPTEPQQHTLDLGSGGL